MQLSVIILNYNVKYFLEICINSVQKAIKNLQAEIIIVDNNSTDGSIEMLKTKFPDLKLIQNAENVGFPKGNNIGFKETNGKYVCILNPDTIVTEDTFEIALAKIENQSEIGILGCKLIDGSGNFLPESKRGIPTPFVAFTKVFGLYKLHNYFGKYYAQHLTENQSGNVEILVGAFMIMKSSFYKKLKGFDENCFMYSDDIDLSYRALQLNLTNYYLPTTSVIHFKGESTIRNQLYMKRFQEAMNYFYTKHFKKSKFFSFFMKIGAFLFSIFKKFEGKSIKLKPEAYYFISNNIKSNQKINLVLQKEVKMIDLSQTFSLKTPIEVIFDTNYITFKESISFMKKNKSKNVTFKFLSQNTDYLIGSNNKNDKGEVILL